ncbi:MAG: radical SAM protein [Pleomorphochaeta sp.]
MANIMLTKRCNLRCPYCFAEEFVGKSSDDITLQNLQKAIDFALTNEDEEIGLIGGEPTVHPKFKEILELIINDERIQSCILFTNGILVDKFVKQLSHPKFRILINCNSPTDIGEKAFEKTKQNIDLLANEYYMKEKITLGINMYKSDFDYDYIFGLLNISDFSSLRTSVSIPNSKEIVKMTSLEYFKMMKPRVLEFYYKLLDNGVMPFYDCNAIPQCILTPLEYKTLETKIIQNGFEDKNLLSDITSCSPVIDILPDLHMIRCFALSEYKVKCSDFNNISEARAYFSNYFDSLAYLINVNKECDECFNNKTMKCTAGCLAFKIEKMLKAKERIFEIND